MSIKDDIINLDRNYNEAVTAIIQIMSEDEREPILRSIRLAYRESRLALIQKMRDEQTHQKVKVILFKPGGKYYTEEEWSIPENAIGPYDMLNSPDFHRIDGGPVLVVTQEPWGYPHLLV